MSDSYILVKQPGESDAGPCVVGVEVVVQVGEVEAEAVRDVHCHFVSAKLVVVGDGQIIERVESR